MGFKMSVPYLGLTRNPNESRKHRAYGLKICKEAGYERASASRTLDRSLSDQNIYEGYRSGEELWEYIADRADSYRMSVAGKDKAGNEVIRERKLPHNAVVGFAIIWKPPAEVIREWDRETRDRFFADCDAVAEELEPELFQPSNFYMTATHFDEVRHGGDEHRHKIGIPRTFDGRYNGSDMLNHMYRNFNKNFAAKMRERGWDMDDLELYDPERAKVDEEYRADRQERRRSYGKSVNDHAADVAARQAEAATEARIKAEEAARDALQKQLEATELAEQKQAEADQSEDEARYADDEAWAATVRKHEIDAHAAEAKAKADEAEAEAKAAKARQSEADRAATRARESADAYVEQVRKSADEDRKQAAEDRRQAAEDRSTAQERLQDVEAALDAVDTVSEEDEKLREAYEAASKTGSRDYFLSRVLTSAGKVLHDYLEPRIHPYELDTFDRIWEQHIVKGARQIASKITATLFPTPEQKKAQAQEKARAEALRIAKSKVDALTQKQAPAKRSDGTAQRTMISQQVSHRHKGNGGPQLG